jgi:hypothetical protein
MTHDFFMRNILPGIISCLSITIMYLIGEKRRYSFLVGLGNQALWLSWLIYIGTWGMLPTVAAMVFMYVRNYQKWTTA